MSAKTSLRSLQHSLYSAQHFAHLSNGLRPPLVPSAWQVKTSHEQAVCSVMNSMLIVSYDLQAVLKSSNLHVQHMLQARARWNHLRSGGRGNSDFLRKELQGYLSTLANVHGLTRLRIEV
jgi:hypothetical protein